MARMRMIKPEFWTDETIIELEPIERLLFIGLWNFANDYGSLLLHPKSIKAKIFPADDISENNIIDMIKKLCEYQLILIYKQHDKFYLYINNWKKHQKIDRPHPSNTPEFYYENTLKNLDVEFYKYSFDNELTLIVDNSSIIRRLFGDASSLNNNNNNNTKNNNKTKCKLINTENPDLIKLAKHLYEKSKTKHNSSGKVPNDNDYNRWAAEFRKMLEFDNLVYKNKPISIDTIEAMINHVSANNGFVVCSGKSLRDKAEKILVNMARAGNSNFKNNNDLGYA